MPLKLLHLSDIHFKHFDGKNYLDQDDEIRNELERDLENLKTQIGTIDVVLVGGDIAFSGAEEEYKIADSWLKKICRIINCSEENVLTVPGNHDVNRNAICPIVSTIHKDFKEMKTRGQIDSKLYDYLKSTDSYAFLSKPLNNYLNFAQKFGSVPIGNPLFWEKDFEVDGSMLRIRGINSAIVSNASDDKNLSKLVVGSLQTKLLRADGVIYLVLCHHPPDWLIDGDEVESDLNATAKIHLFGHKHKLSVTKINESLRLAAGAMQPSRKEGDWDPRYNIIQIEIEKFEQNSLVKIDVWKRMWHKDSKKFRADVTEDNMEAHKYSLKHETASPYKVKTDTNANASISHKKTSGIEMSKDIEKIDPSSPNPLRKLAYMFHSLSYHKKIEIASALKLIVDSDQNLHEIQKSQLYVMRAKERDQLDELWDKTVEQSSDKPLTSNPFKK